MLVVIGHSQTSVAILAHAAHVAFTRCNFLPWGAGVDLFFVISGFIMVYASQRLFGASEGALEFLRRRMVRVAPFYWLCTLAYLAIVALAHTRGDHLTFSPQAIVASLLFIRSKATAWARGCFPFWTSAGR